MTDRDVVERLRNWREDRRRKDSRVRGTTYYLPTWVGDLFEEAADEIERRRKDVQWWATEGERKLAELRSSSDRGAIVERLIRIREWNHDHDHDARREYDRLADEARALSSPPGRKG